MLATRTAAVAAASPRREEGRAYVDLQAGIYFIDWRAASAPPTSGNLLPHSPAVSSPICVPAFAREASEGCHAEAHRAKAGCAVRELRPGNSPLATRGIGPGAAVEASQVWLGSQRRHVLGDTEHAQILLNALWLEDA